MQADKKEALNRLAYIEGHVRGIRKMVEEDQYCVDIIKQTRAVKRALDKFDALLLRNHLSTCVPEGIREGRDEQIISELNDLFDLAQR
jgi:DNA-binding FrmR family transcriptional regulator